MLNSRFQKLVYPILLFFLVQVGCGSAPAKITQPMFASTSTESIKIFEMNIDTPSPPASNSLRTPTRTSIQPNPTPNQAKPSQTPTLSPTLNAAEREVYVKELLQANAGCDLPCWWGIMPGKTQWADTARFLEIIGVNTIRHSEPFGSIMHETGGFDFGSPLIANDISFSENSGLVDYILVDTKGYLNVIGFHEAWQTYAPLQIIQKYGKPSRVWLKSEYSRDTPGKGYELWLFYDQLGFLITYTGSIGPKKPTYHICPRFEGEHVEELRIYLQSAESKRPLEQLTYYVLPGHGQYFQPIEKAGITIDEFYDAFLQEKQPCFNIPGSIFP